MWSLTDLLRPKSCTLSCGRLEHQHPDGDLPMWSLTDLLSPVKSSTRRSAACAIRSGPPLPT